MATLPLKAQCEYGKCLNEETFFTSTGLTIAEQAQRDGWTSVGMQWRCPDHKNREKFTRGRWTLESRAYDPRRYRLSFNEDSLGPSFDVDVSSFDDLVEVISLAQEARKE